MATTKIHNQFIVDNTVKSVKLSIPPVIAIGSPQTQVGAVINVNIQMQDADGNNVSRAVRLVCRALKGDAAQANLTEFTLAEVGAGTALTTSNRPSLVVETSSGGQATVSVTDAVPPNPGTMYLSIIPADTPCIPSLIPVTFS